jgi:DNA-binding transcriptional MerR regulator
MSSQHAYSPAEICKMFGISKSTLFRWEQESWFPVASRDLGGQRQYTQEHIRAISENQKRRLGREYQRAIEQENSDSMLEFAEALSMRKFLANDPTGIQELAEYSRLSANTILQLVRLATEQYHPYDPMFCRILGVAYQQSCKLGDGSSESAERNVDGDTDTPARS